MEIYGIVNLANILETLRVWIGQLTPDELITLDISFTDVIVIKLHIRTHNLWSVDSE